MIKIHAPLFIELGARKIRRYHINLNAYRNWHHMVSNNIKKAYAEAVFPQIRGLEFRNISLEFVLWKATKRKVDRANVLSIHEKFFCDALVGAGCLEDDNDDFISVSTYRTGGIDRDNPRVDIIIREIS